MISDQNVTAWLPAVGEIYGAKYEQGLQYLGLTLNEMAAKYTQAIVVTPTKVTAW